MKILSVLGSPQRKGNTATLLDSFLKGIEENHSGIEISNVFVHGENIDPCTGCDSCKNSSEKACIIDDDMQKHYEEFLLADVIILATPVYWFNMSAQLKKFIDRLYALDFSSFPSGKKLVLLTTYGDTDEYTSGAINISNSMKQAARYLKMDFIIDYGMSSESSVSRKTEALDKAYELGKII